MSRVKPRKYRMEVAIDRLQRRRAWDTRRMRGVRYVVVHRCDVIKASRGRILTNSPEDCARYFVDRGWRGHPYHFDVGEGDIVQCNPIDAHTAGVRFKNASSIHVRVRGDFRKFAPSVELWNTVACLCADLAGLIDPGVGRRLEVIGHSEFWLRGILKAIQLKDCPGKQFDMDGLRVAVSRMLRDERTTMPVLPAGSPWWRWWTIGASEV